MLVAEAIEKKETKEKNLKIYTLEEYFKHEEASEHKSEFHNGKIIPMSGGTIAHNRVKIMLTTLLNILAIQSELDFEVLDSDQKVYIPEENKSLYPDALIILGEPEMYQGGNQAILNPALVVEVLSDSTESYDRGEKFRMYQSLPSFQEYVLVDQKTPVIDVFQKEGEREWRLKTYIGLEEEVYLKTIDATLKMKDIYKKVKNLQKTDGNSSEKETEKKDEE